MSELLIVPDRSRAPASASIEILLIRNASNRSSVFYASLRANYLFFSLCLNCFTLMSVRCVCPPQLCANVFSSHVTTPLVTAHHLCPCTVGTSAPQV